MINDAKIQRHIGAKIITGEKVFKSTVPPDDTRQMHIMQSWDQPNVNLRITECCPLACNNHVAG